MKKQGKQKKKKRISKRIQCHVKNLIKIVGNLYLKKKKRSKNRRFLIRSL